MAILYTTGTINQPDAGSVGLAMAEQFRDDLVLHPAWDLVEEFTAASGNVRWYVFKCLASASGLSADYYAIMGRTLASGELRFAICEDYDAVTHTMSHIAPNYSTNQYAHDSLGRQAHTFVLGTANFTSNQASPKSQNWLPAATSTKWWICAAEDGFTVAFNGTPNEFVHVGAYIPLTPLTIDLPIQIMGSSSSEGAMTRNPAVASSTIYGVALNTSGGGSNSVTTGFPLGFRGSLINNDKMQNNQRTVGEMGITVYPGISNPEPLIGWALGKQKRMRVGSGSAPTGFAFGDAYVLDGRLWVPYKPDDVRMFDTGVAA